MQHIKIKEGYVYNIESYFGFRVLLKKSGSRTPRVEVEEMGPSLDLVMRRTHLASDDLMKAATKVPRVVKVTFKFSINYLSTLEIYYKRNEAKMIVWKCQSRLILMECELKELTHCFSCSQRK